MPTLDRPSTKRPSARSRHSTIPILAGAILSLCVPAQGASVTWDSDASAGNAATDGSGIWDTSLLNWYNGTTDVAWPNTTADTAIIGAGGTGGIITLGSSVTVGNLIFNALASGNYTINSTTTPATETLTIGNGGSITVNAAGTTTIESDLHMSSAAGALGLAGAGDLTLNGSVGFNAATSGAITKTGAGTLTLGGITDNFSLSLTMSSGTVLLGKTSSTTVHALGGATTINGGVLRLSGSGGDQIQDTATAIVTVNGSGLFDLNGLSEKIVGLAGTGTVGNTAGTLATLELGAGGTVDTTFSGQIQDNLAVRKSGGGVQTLSSANTYTGGTFLTGGTLNIANAGALGGGTLSLSGGNIQAGIASLTLSNAITLGTADTGVTGANNLTLSGPITNTNTTAVGLETRGIGQTTTLSGPIYLTEAPATARTLRLQTNATTGAFSKIVVSGVLADANGIYSGTFGQSITLNPNAVGSSILLSGANTYGANNGGTASVTSLGGGNVGTIVVGNNSAFGTSTVSLNQAKLATDGGNYTIANNITFQGGPSSFVGTGNLTITGTVTNNQNSFRFNNNGTGVVTFAGPMNLLSVSTLWGGTGSTVISGPITTNSDPFGGQSGISITLKGPGSLTLSGDNSGRTGTTFVDGGTLTLDYSTQDNSKLANGSPLGFNGGNLIITGGSHAELVSATTIFNGNGSASNITRTSGSATLQLNAITRGANSTTLNVGENNLVTTDNTNTAAGIIAGYFTVGRADWAVNSTNAADGPVVALTTYETGGETVWGGTSNALVSDSTALTAGRTVNTLKVTTTTSGQSLDLAGFTLGVTTNGALMFTGANDYAINNTVNTGTLYGTANQEKILFQNATGRVTINAVLAGGTGRLTKAGTGTLVLTAANTFSGQVSINEGVLEVSSNGNLGDEVAGAQINLNGAGILRANTTGGSFGLYRGVAGTNNRNVLLGNAGGTIDVTGPNSLTIAGTVTGGTPDAGGLTKTGPGTLVLTNAANSYAGPTRIFGGTIAVNTLANFNTNSGIAGGGTNQNNPNYLQIDGGTLQWIGATAQSTNRNFTIGTGGAALDASGTVPGNVLTYGGSPVFSTSNTANALTLTGTGGDNTAPNIFSGILVDNGTGATSLVKSGTGAWTLNNTSNRFTGPITINGGKLSVSSAGTLGTGSIAVNSTGTLAANLGGVVSRSVTVNSGGNLLGAGTVSGAVTLNNGGSINLIDSTPVTLTLGGGLSLNGGSVLGFDLGAVGSSDLLAMTGGAFSATGTTTINLNSVAGFTAGTYDLVTGASGINASNFTLGTGLLGSFTYALDVLASKLRLTVTGSVPAQAFWRGDVSGVWNVTGNTNFATALAGTTDTGAIPGFSTDVIFSSTPAQNLSTTLGQDFSIKSLTFNGTPSGAVSIGGLNTLSIGTGITVASGAGPVTISTSQLAMTGSQTWTNNSVNPLNVSANVTGAFVLTKAGTGDLNLSGTNTYSGGTVISNGTVLAGSGSALGTGNVTLSGGTLDVNGQSLLTGLLAGTSGTVRNNAGTLAALTLSNVGTATFGGTIQDGTGPLALLKQGTGTQILLGNHTYTGGTTINAGTLQLGDPTQSLDGSISGDVVNNGRLAIFNSSATFTYGGTISGSGILAKDGIAALELNGNNTYTGGTTVSTGRIVLGTDTALGTGDVTIGASGTVSLNGHTITNNFPTLAATGSIVNDSVTPAAITGTIGNLGFNPGNFGVGGTGDLTLNTVTSNGVFTVTKFGTGTLSLNGTVDNASGQFVVNEGTVLLNKTSTSTVHSAGGLNNTPAITVNGGTVRITGTGGDQIFNSSIVAINGGVFDLNGSTETIAGFNGSGAGTLTNNLAASSSVLTVGSGTVSGNFTGTIADGASGGTVGINKIGTGTQTLGGTLTYTGATNITAGTLLVSAQLSGSTSINVSGGATLSGLSEFDLGSGQSLTGGSGSTAGNVIGKVVQNAGSTLAPGLGLGAIGRVSVSNGFSLNSGAHLALDIFGTAGSVSYDQLVVTAGDVSLAGDLVGTTLSFTPTAFTDVFFIILNNGSGLTTGTLGGVPQGGTFDLGGQTFQINYFADSTFTDASNFLSQLGNDVALLAVPEPGSIASLFCGVGVLLGLRRRPRQSVG